jgi:hypothetical protein
MSKVKITIEGDFKLAGYMSAAIIKMVNPENTPLTKVSPIHLEEKKNALSFEVESRI